MLAEGSFDDTGYSWKTIFESKKSNHFSTEHSNEKQWGRERERRGEPGIDR